MATQTDKTHIFYNQNAHDFIERTWAVDMSPLYAEFLPYLPEGGAVLDAGCGSGRDAYYFAKQGLYVSAFDSAEEIVKIARTKTGLPVEHRSFEEVDEIERYDGIWCCASLLHILPEALPTIINKLINALKPNGVIYLSFKYGEGVREKDGRIFTDLNEVALKALLEPFAEEITLEKMWLTGDQRVDSQDTWLNAIIKKG